MRVVNERCCGLDVHKSSLTACAMVPEGKQLRSFGTTTPRLQELIGWLRSLQVNTVAMESSGIYWRPVFNLLEEAGLEVVVANARHIKAVPGRKTDVRDAEWIADLLRHGLLKPSFIPNRQERELRDLVRYRRTLIEQRAHEIQRVHKVLEADGSAIGSRSTRWPRDPKIFRVNNLGGNLRRLGLGWIQFHGGDAMVNKVILVGNLTADPDVKATPKGTYVAKLRLATNTYAGKDETGNRKEQTEYHNLVAFGKLAELAGQYIQKGRQIYAEGRLHTSSWEDAAGQKRFRTEVILDDLQFLGKKPQEAAA